MKIGILAIQGDVIEHQRVLEKLGVGVREVRLPDDVDGISGIILPGGESTTQSLLLKRFGLLGRLKEKIEKGFPVWGTCAGAILLAKKVTGKNPPETLSVMDIEAERNAYGSQLESFTAKVSVAFSTQKGGFETLPDASKPLPAVFIRAPLLKPLSGNVAVKAEYQGQPVMLEQGNMIAASFHPELTDDFFVHKYFLSICARG